MRSKGNKTQLLLKRPTARQFFDPVLKVLGRLTNYKPRVGVHYREVLDLVLHEVGIDPTNSPWPLRGSRPLGLYRIIAFAYRNQRPDTISCRYSGRRTPHCLWMGRGMWGLTSEGVKRAKELKEVSFTTLIPKDLNPRTIFDAEESSKDTRDDLTWVVLELSRVGESRVEEDSLESVLRRDLRVGEDFPIFVPAISYRRGDKVVTCQLMEGYAFVAAGLDEVAYFSLEHTPYVNQVMSAIGPNGLRALHVIPDQSIEEMRKKLRGFIMLDVDFGDQVRVLEGKYKGLTLEVLCLEEEHVIARTTELRSCVIITRLPRMFLALA